MNKKTVRDIDLKDKKVLVRCDFNVPMDENQNIKDNRRIVAALPTIKYLLEQNCKVVLCSHLGRPKGEVKPEFSLQPVAKELSILLNMEVVMAKDVIGEDAKKKASELKCGEAMLLENLRFHREETDNDPEFAKALSEFGEVFVNDAFGTAHRAHASTEGVTHYLPAVSGFLIEKELEFLGNALENPKRPFVAILGGAKVSDKISVIEGDYRNLRNYFKNESFDLVLANPPYRAIGSGAANAIEGVATARHEFTATLEDVVTAARFALKYHGIFCMIHITERLCEIIDTLHRHQFEMKRLRLIQPKLRKPPNLMLIEAMVGGAPGSLKIETPLIVHNDDGSYAEEIKFIYGLKGGDNC